MLYRLADWRKGVLATEPMTEQARARAKRLEKPLRTLLRIGQ
jgi:hypothetical protein